MWTKMSISTFYVTFFLVLQQVQGDCVFPTFWQTHDWFKNYDTNNLADHWQVHYENADYTWISVNGFLEFTVEFECTARTGNNNVTYYILEQTSFDSMFCCLTHTGVNSLAHKVIPHTAVSSSPVSECPDAVKALEVDVYPSYPFSFTTTKCPFEATTYQLQYTTATSGGVMCEDDDTSVVTVTDDGRILINSCFQGTSSFGEPLRDVELTCIDTFSELIMDNDGGGDLLILADTADDVFYCARYTVAYGKVHLSLNVDGSSAVVCYPYVTSQTVSEYYVALTFSLDVPSTTPSKGGVTDDGGGDSDLAEHIVIDFSYEYVDFIDGGNSLDSLIFTVKSLITDLIDSASPSRFINIEVTKGADVNSIPLVNIIDLETSGTLLEFDIMPDFFGVPVEEVVALLENAVRTGAFRFRRDGKFLTANRDFFYHYYVPQGGPCAVYSCENGGECIQLTISKAICDCTPEYTGFTCETDASSNEDTTYNKILISVLTLAGAIFIITIVSVIVCLRYRDRRAPSLTPLDEEVSVSEVDFGMPKIWNAGYNQYGNSTYHEPYVY